ncbi:hypothetical protein BDZ85DRAFT_257428 [Elsinoe ampelina]|uniref:Uncharacterized protein n=1 Tax=Elsinoe ampelina TaxID=302913 RepID=A0A6A6GI92_9PEZI|nr:hypothetical protein BDZ85DRAFT_257428 [Elsinoe ampelina]
MWQAQASRWRQLLTLSTTSFSSQFHQIPPQRPWLCTLTCAGESHSMSSLDLYACNCATIRSKRQHSICETRYTRHTMSGDGTNARSEWLLY